MISDYLIDSFGTDTNDCIGAKYCSFRRSLEGGDITAGGLYTFVVVGGGKIIMVLC
jgi:hypothetical protein